MKRWVWVAGAIWLLAVTTRGYAEIAPFDAGAALPTTPGFHKLDFKTQAGGKAIRMPYLLFIPKGYAASTAPAPTLVFLHGGLECGTNLDGVFVHGPACELSFPERQQFRDSFPFIMICPQCPPRGQAWDDRDNYHMVDAVLNLITFVQSKLRVDADHMYLTGLSMGGDGSWAIGMDAADRFAAVVPIASWTVRGGDISRLDRMPVWTIAGRSDGRSCDTAQKMAELMARRGNTPRLSIEPHMNHIVWPYFYQNPQFYEWLLEHKRGQGPAYPIAMPTEPGHHLRYFEKQVGENIIQMPYSIYIPKNYAPQGDHPSPAILFLHEGEVVGKLINGVCMHGPELAVEENHDERFKQDFPFVIISPKRPILVAGEIGTWDKTPVTITLSALMDEVVTRLNIDRTRVYVTGVHGGAKGAMQLALRVPDRFAAVAPVMGTGPLDLPEGAARKLRSMPTWAVLLNNDTESLTQLRAANDANKDDIQINEVPPNQLVDPLPIYQEPDLYRWLTRHTLPHQGN